MDSRFPSLSRPGECRAQINSLHSSGTAARTQKSLFCRRCPGPTPCPALLPPLASLQCSACGAPLFLSTARPRYGRVILEDPISPPLPTDPTPYRPRPQELQRVLRGARGSSARLRFGKSLPHPNNLAPLSGTRTVGCGSGGVRSWGKVRAFKEGGRPAPGTSPAPESFPSGATECARGWRGGREGVEWGVDRVAARPPPPRESAAGGWGRQLGPGRKPRRSLRPKAATRALPFTHLTPSTGLKEPPPLASL